MSVPERKALLPPRLTSSLTMQTFQGYQECKGAVLEVRKVGVVWWRWERMQDSGCRK